MWEVVIVLAVPFVFGVLLTLFIMNRRHNTPSRRLERELREIHQIGAAGRRQVSSIARELETINRSSTGRRK